MKNGNSSGGLINNLYARAELYRAIRAFFQKLQVLEVELPTLSSSFVSDPYIEPIIAQYKDREYYLQSSPEYFMKRLLPAVGESIYSLGKAYRYGEQGSRHNPEFTLLEWYRMGFDDHALMDEVATLVGSLLPDLVVHKISYRQWFLNELGLDPHQATAEMLRQQVSSCITIESEGLEYNDWLDLLVTHVLEPKLPQGLVFIYDYPKSQAALARITPDSTGVLVARRFEAFLNGVELANGYWELTCAKEQRARFEKDLVVRARQGLPSYPLDEALLSALDSGLPNCAGVALGVDRLLMQMLGMEHIKQVLAFDFSRV